MFEERSAKRINRSEVLDSDNAVESPNEADKAVNPNYGFDYDFISLPTSKPTPRKQLDPSLEQPSDLKADSPPDPEAQEETHAFRLFTSTAPSTFTIRPPTPDSSLLLSSGRFLHPSRPDSYYFTSAASPSLLEQHQHHISLSAITSTSVLAQSTATWPGTSLPWRVIHLKPPSNKTGSKSSKPSKSPKPAKSHLPSQTAPPSRSAARTKPSKKRRILLRHRLAARQPLKQQATVDLEAERLKRNARNREKKVKRRERERKKKAEARLQERQVAGTGDGGGDESENGGRERGKGEEEEGEEEESRTEVVK